MTRDELIEAVNRMIMLNKVRLHDNPPSWIAERIRADNKVLAKAVEILEWDQQRNEEGAGE